MVCRQHFTARYFLCRPPVLCCHPHWQWQLMTTGWCARRTHLNTLTPMHPISPLCFPVHLTLPKLSHHWRISLTIFTNPLAGTRWRIIRQSTLWRIVSFTLITDKMRLTVFSKMHIMKVKSGTNPKIFLCIFRHIINSSKCTFPKNPTQNKG